MCQYNWCEICQLDFSQWVDPFTYACKPKPENYAEMLVKAAERYEENRKRFCPIEKYWPPRKLGAEESLLRAARGTGVCPDELAFYINSDQYQTERLEEEYADYISAQ